MRPSTTADSMVHAGARGTAPSGPGEALAEFGFDAPRPGEDAGDVEHASVLALIDQLRCMDAIDRKYATRFDVLCDCLSPDSALQGDEDERGDSPAGRLAWRSFAADGTERRDDSAARPASHRQRA